MSLKVKYWGVRGSLPTAPSPQEWVQHILKLNEGCESIADLRSALESMPVVSVGGYGTATTCVEVQSSKQRIIIDGGSGLRALSEQIMSCKVGSDKGPFHIFMTHFHWDHIIGLPFFTPHFIPGAQIHYYAVQKNIEEAIKGVFKKPYFPVPFGALSSKVHFHVLQPRKAIQINDLTITPYQLDHPDECWGFKIQNDGKTYAHCVDTEGTRFTREDLQQDLPLYQNVDLMYFDAQYTFPELAEKANWGHSASQIGLDIAFREGIKKVLFAHHDPGASLHQIENLIKQTQEFYDWRKQSAIDNKENFNDVDWSFAHEGFEIDL
ncbi:MAG: MBL fold metallo-hydrolase [Pseudobdellovibrionaceae bacterium]